MRQLISTFTLAVCLGLGLFGCESAPAPTPRTTEPPAEPPPPPLDVFSAARSWQDLEALVGIGPRVAGTEGGERARTYLRGQLEEVGLEAVEQPATRSVEGAEDVTLRHLVVTLPGSSPKLFVLVAPYDSSQLQGFDSVGANEGGSSAAVLLELARVLSTRSLAYTTRLVFLDGEGLVEGHELAPGVARWTGSATLAEQMQEAGELESILLLVALHRVGDADLRIARDLSSHRMHREEFFRAAQRVGRTDPFPRGQGFESPAASHLAFLERGVRPSVALVDTRYGGDAVPGVYSESPEDTLAHCAPESLDAVGLVILEALDVIARRLAKIDRFSRSPLAEVEAPDDVASERGSPPEEPAPEGELAPAPDLPLAPGVND